MKIYLSSTFEDLKDHRKAVWNILRKAGHRVIAMEDYVACDPRPLDKCLADVATVDLYVGLFAFRYGYVPPAGHGNPDGLSITELEYRTAEKQAHTACITFVLDPKERWSNAFSDYFTGENRSGESIGRLRDHLRKERLAPSFTTPHQLAGEVLAAVAKMERDRSGPGSGTEPTASTREEGITWDIARLGSPYPGLLHFTRRYAPVYFGREADVRAVIDRMDGAEGRFLMVSGDSGSGKSSLVDAGVLPALSANGLPSAASFQPVYLLPSRGRHPMDALMRSLQSFADPLGIDPDARADTLANDPSALPATLEEIITQGADADTLVLFIDQMEELFTGVESDSGVSRGFLSGLAEAIDAGLIWVIATIRSDFLHHCHRHPMLLEVLRGKGHYPLGPLEKYMVRDMIVRPAECAGLWVEQGLADRLISDLGTEPGSLPLLAFVLQRLFEGRQDERLALDTYQRLGGTETGMHGVLAEYAGSVEASLGDDALERLASLFDRLLTVNAEGGRTRRWIALATLDIELQSLAKALVDKRLLTTVGDRDSAAVSIAHERLFEAWPALAQWVGRHEAALHTLSMAEIDAAQWRRHGYDLAYLWHPERLQQLQQILEDMPARQTAELLEYGWPGERLLECLQRDDLSHEQRLTMGRLMAVLGDPRSGVGVDEHDNPVIDWVPVPGGEIRLEDDAGRRHVEAFEIGRYPITCRQFQAFIDAQDGYANAAWWTGLAREKAAASNWTEPNGPRETVSWYEAVAFSRWLSKRLGYEVRLPDEFEWQQAATAGKRQAYPWGDDWQEGYCNSAESGLNRTTAVGLYLHGTWPGGPLDMAGNVWEWCLNRYDKPEDCQLDTAGDTRVLRGGAWGVASDLCRGAYRYFYLLPGLRLDFVGFRLVRPPSSGH